MFATCHPCMLGTAVKLDTGAIVTAPPPIVDDVDGDGDAAGAAGTAAAVVGARFDEPRCLGLGLVVGARFDEPRCLAAFCPTQAGPGQELQVEVIDARSGLALPDPSSSPLSSMGDAAARPSALCSHRLLVAFKTALIRALRLDDDGDGYSIRIADDVDAVCIAASVSDAGAVSPGAASGGGAVVVVSAAFVRDMLVGGLTYRDCKAAVALVLPAPAPAAAPGAPQSLLVAREVFAAAVARAPAGDLDMTALQSLLTTAPAAAASMPLSAYARAKAALLSDPRHGFTAWVRKNTLLDHCH